MYCCNSLAYALLGHCITSVHRYHDSVTTFGRYVENDILEPLDMTSTLHLIIPTSKCACIYLRLCTLCVYVCTLS